MRRLPFERARQNKAVQTATENRHLTPIGVSCTSYAHMKPNPRLPHQVPPHATRVTMPQMHVYCISSDGSADACRYKDLIKGNPDETEIRSFPVNGNQVSVTLRIPNTLRDAAKEETALRGMSFSAFVRTCMLEELAKKGA